jgi:hypothetical protein
MIPIVKKEFGNTYISDFFSGTAQFYNADGISNTSLTSSVGYNTFIAKVSANGVWKWAVKIGGRKT